MNVKKSKSLFDAWQNLGNKIRNMGSVVANDYELSDTNLIEWQSMTSDLQTQIGALAAFTTKHCQNRVHADVKNDEAKALPQNIDHYLFEED